MLTFLSFLVVTFGVTIALAQWYLARSKLKLDLFDRRWAIIKSLREIIGITLRDDELELKELWEFGYNIYGVRWLFGSEVEEYLSLVQKKLSQFRANRRIAKSSLNEERRQQASANADEILQWLSDQFSEFDKVFGPYMHINEPFNVWFVRKIMKLKRLLKPVL